MKFVHGEFGYQTAVYKQAGGSKPDLWQCCGHFSSGEQFLAPQALSSHSYFEMSFSYQRKGGKAEREICG